MNAGRLKFQPIPYSGQEPVYINIKKYGVNIYYIRTTMSVL